MQNIVHVEKRVVQGMPVLTAILTVTSSVSEDETEAFRRLWTAMYDEHPRFMLEVDLTGVSLLSGMDMLQRVVSILKDHRARSKEQIPVTGVVVPMMQRPLLEAGLLFYEPITPLVRSHDLEKLRDMMDTIAVVPSALALYT